MPKYSQKNGATVHVACDSSAFTVQTIWGSQGSKLSGRRRGLAAVCFHILGGRAAERLFALIIFRRAGGSARKLFRALREFLQRLKFWRLLGSSENTARDGALSRVIL